MTTNTVDLLHARCSAKRSHAFSLQFSQQCHERVVTLGSLFSTRGKEHKSLCDLLPVPLVSVEERVKPRL